MTSIHLSPAERQELLDHYRRPPRGRDPGTPRRRDLQRWRESLPGEPDAAWVRRMAARGVHVAPLTRGA